MADTAEISINIGVLKINLSGILAERIESKKRYSKVKIKERIKSKTDDLPLVLKKILTKYIVIKMVKIAMVSRPKVKPEKKSKNTATRATHNRPAGVLFGFSKANRTTKIGKIKTGHGVITDSARSKMKIIAEDMMKNFGLVINIIATPYHEIRFGL